MRTMRLLLFAGLLLSPAACRPKLTVKETTPDTAALVAPTEKLLQGKWELLEARGAQQLLPWLHQKADFSKGRVLEFTKDHELLYRRGDERVRRTTYQLITPEIMDIDMVLLLAGDMPAVPLDKMRVAVQVNEKELTLTLLKDKLQRFDRYRRMEEAKRE
jgi:hypothetical protein